MDCKHRIQIALRNPLLTKPQNYVFFSPYNQNDNFKRLFGLPSLVINVCIIEIYETNIMIINSVFS